MKDIVILIAGSITFWGLWGFFAKLATQRIGVQATFWNALAFFIIVTSFLILQSQFVPIKKNFSGIAFALLAGTFSALAAVAFYLSLGKKPAGFVAAAVALYPVITIILSVLFLKETFTISKVMGVILAVCALFLLSL